MSDEQSLVRALLLEHKAAQQIQDLQGSLLKGPHHSKAKGKAKNDWQRSVAIVRAILREGS